ncbi:MAG: hypothetical protein ACRC9V_16440, partial [Aeromonas sp.]
FDAAALRLPTPKQKAIDCANRLLFWSELNMLVVRNGRFTIMVIRRSCYFCCIFFGLTCGLWYYMFLQCKKSDLALQLHNLICQNEIKLVWFDG